MTTYLFDTSIVVEIFRQNAAIIQRAAQLQQNQDTYVISSTTVGDLYFGAYRAQHHRQDALTKITDLIQTTPVCTCDIETGRLYGEIKEALTTAGQIIPDNDMWIAATARQYSLALATLDAHFSRITGLRLEQW